MKEFDDFKKELGKLVKVFGKLVQALWSQLDKGVSKFIPDSKVRGVVLIGISCFIVGSLVGSMMQGGGGEKKERSRSKSSFSLFKKLFGPKFEIAGKQKDGRFVLANFEKPSDLKLWTLQAAKMVPSTSHETQGAQSGMFTFFGDVESAAIHIEDYFESRGGLSNWKDYGFLVFDVYNPQSTKQRLIMQVKDTNGDKYKQSLHLPAKTTQSFKIPMARIDGRIDLKKISQFTIFKWKPKVEKSYYLDNLHLAPEGLPGSRVGEGAINPATKFPKAPKPVNRPVNLFDYGFKHNKQKWLVWDPALQAKVVRVPFILKDETGVVRHLWPAQGGIPFAPAELKSLDHLRVVDAARNNVPFQARTLGTWPDKSIRWAQVDMQASLNARAGVGYFLEYHPRIKRSHPGSPLVLEKTDTRYQVNTGTLKFTIDRKSFNLFDEVFLDINEDGQFSANERIASKVPLNLVFRGKEYTSHFDNKSYKMEVEEKGPEKIALKATGWFQNKKGERYCQWIIRIHAFKGKSYLRVYHTFIYTGFPENRYYERYKDLKLPANETIQDMGIDIPLDFKNNRTKVTFGISGSNPLLIQDAESVQLFQEAFDRNTLDQDEENRATNLNVSGWVDVSDDRAGLTVAIRDFKEQFPKAFYFDDNKKTLSVKIWPERAGELDLKTTADAFGPEARARGSAFGLAKTHELFFHFHRGDASDPQVIYKAAAFQEPLITRVNPYWLRSTGVLGDLYPVEERYAQQEKVLEKLFDWAARHPKDFKWYGMLDFGDTATWFRKEDSSRWYGSPGWHPIGRWGWYNCENAGTHSGALLQFIRSGEYKYFEFGENLARHIMDVDTVHYNTIKNDPRLKALDDEVSQVGSMHRHNGNHWGGRNEETTHTNVYGILLYYYLTGYERALDVAKESGSFFLKNPVTYTRHPDIAPHRALANVLWGDVLLYLATGDIRYKQGADQIMEIYLQGQNSDGSYYEQYDPMTGTWTGKKHKLYMAYYAVRAFIAYHELTQDPRVLKALEGMVRFVRSDKYLAPSVLNGLAYLYKATRNPEFIQLAEKDFRYFMKSQRVSGDSMYDGLIYKKPTYHRPNVFLFSVPFVFGAFEDAFAAQGAPQK